MSHFLQDFDLSGDSLNVFLVLNLILFKDLNGNFLSREGMLAKFDLSKSSFSQMFSY